MAYFQGQTVSFREGTTFETVGCVSDRQKKPTLAGSLGKSLAVAFVPRRYIFAFGTQRDVHNVKTCEILLS